MGQFSVEKPVLPGSVLSGNQHTIEAPSNLMETGALVSLHPAPSVQIRYKIEGLWRYSLHDGFYAAPTFALIKPSAAGGRWSGLEQQVRIDWRIASNLDFAAAYVRFAPSAFLRPSRAVSENFAMTELSLRF